MAAHRPYDPCPRCGRGSILRLYDAIHFSARLNVCRACRLAFLIDSDLEFPDDPDMIGAIERALFGAD